MDLLKRSVKKTSASLSETFSSKLREILHRTRDRAESRTSDEQLDRTQSNSSTRGGSVDGAAGGGLGEIKDEKNAVKVLWESYTSGGREGMQFSMVLDALIDAHDNQTPISGSVVHSSPNPIIPFLPPLPFPDPPQLASICTASGIPAEHPPPSMHVIPSHKTSNPSPLLGICATLSGAH